MGHGKGDRLLFLAFRLPLGAPCAPMPRIPRGQADRLKGFRLRVQTEGVQGQEKGTGYFFLPSDSRVAYRAAPMPRIPRGQVAGHAYHVLNRGNGGATVFHKDGDYTACLDLLATAKAMYPVKVFGFCLMPNHFHLVLGQEKGTG